MEETIVAFVYGLLGGIWKLRHLHNLEIARRKRLVQMLQNPRYRWRSLSVLSANIAADKEVTKELLIQVGARQQSHAPYYWGLIARVGEP